MFQSALLSTRNLIILLLPLSTIGLSRFDPDQPLLTRASNINIVWLTNLSFEITLPDNTTERILLKPVTNNIANLSTPCLFSGKLDADPYSVVAVSGCKDSREVSISIASRMLPNGLVDLSINDGTTYIIAEDSNTDANADDMAMDSNRFKRQAVLQRSEEDYLIPPPDPNQFAHNFVGSDILPEAVILKTSIRYDTSLLQKFGGSHTSAKEWISRVLELTKPRLSLLNIGIQLKVVGNAEHHNEVIEADSYTINRLREETQPNSLVSYFCADIGGGVVGIAYVGAACHTSGYAININEYYREANSELSTAKVFAHELGHNVGMWHDFDEKHGGRGGPCDGEGLMSYGNTPDAWSSCSNSDFRSFYRNSGWCLEEVNIKTAQPAMLITGGWEWDTQFSTEVYFPNTNMGCSVPNFELPARIHTHAMNTYNNKTLLCGGGDAKNYCLEFTPNSLSTTWTKYADLKEARYEHTSWVSSAGIVLIGGYWPYSAKAETTAELVSGDILPFTLPSTRDACAIDDASSGSFILTGGTFTPFRVTRYNLEGLVETLPNMNFERAWHGCGSYDSAGKKVLIVVGGGLGGDIGGGSDSTEKLVVGEGGWSLGSPLPRAMKIVTSLNINNKLYLLGGCSHKGLTDILEYDPDLEVWKKVGDMQKARYRHAAAVIYAHFEDLCN